jgi:hypothetical protein
MKEFYVSKLNELIYSTNSGGDIFIPFFATTEALFEELYSTNFIELTSDDKKIIFELNGDLMFCLGNIVIDNK